MTADPPTAPAAPAAPDEPGAPDGLGPAGAAYWCRVVDEFDLGAVEEPTLLEVCRTLDTIEDLAAALAKHGPVSDAGKPSPLLVEIRQQRAILVRLLGLLDLPADDDGSGRPALSSSRAASKAASERWRKARGGGRFHG